MSEGRILVVEDDADISNMLQLYFKSQGYEVFVAPEGHVALDLTRQKMPNVIVLDIMLPDIDGYEVCRRLRTNLRTSHIPIIFLTQKDDRSDKIHGLELGADDYITKPFQVEEVLARVETHLSLRNLQTQLQDANTRMMMELALAGEVQASFLPRTLPRIPGWQLTVTLQPSRETSGDFYDINLLPNGRLGLLVADVVDKGAGAALFMALCWTLFRTFAVEFPAQPEVVLDAVNKRILEDTNAEQFATAFYGILEPATGNLVYCNAGHCPPFWFKLNTGEKCGQLIRTGVPLGIFRDQTWSQGVVQLDPGDVLVLYSDGVTEAQNVNKCFFGEDRLIEAVSGRLGNSALEIQEGILEDLQSFMGEKSQADDIVLSILMRE